MSIASREGIKCLTVEVAGDRALLQKLSEITFCDEDMEVGTQITGGPFTWQCL